MYSNSFKPDYELIRYCKDHTIVVTVFSLILSTQSPGILFVNFQQNAQKTFKVNPLHGTVYFISLISVPLFDSVTSYSKSLKVSQAWLNHYNYAIDASKVLNER